jgi:hypothetical protein
MQLFVKSVLALPECAADMGPACDAADRGQLSRCCSDGTAGVLLQPAGPLVPMARADPSGFGPCEHYHEYATLTVEFKD